jgi:DNA-directed RNA polymerase sigma subunit (sigma70/sigma32)
METDPKRDQGNVSYLRDLFMATHTSEVEKTSFSYVATLERLLERLPVRSREIVKLRFGVPDGKIRTLEEIGKQHGITRERVRQVVGSALTMIASHKEYPEVVEIMKHIEQALGSKSGVMKVDHLVEKLAGDPQKLRELL